MVREALEFLESKYAREEAFTSPQKVGQYLTLKLAEYESEVFGIAFLDTRHRLIVFDIMFQGTIDGCTVHPRVIAKQALVHNAAAVILAHNHPSGIPEPSGADRHITTRIKDALALLDIRTLDHIVVGGGQYVSFSERGYL